MVGRLVLRSVLVRFCVPVTVRRCAQLCLLQLLTLGLLEARGADTLPGTKPLTQPGDLSVQMQTAVDGFLLRLTDNSAEHRSNRWNRNYATVATYVESVGENRERFRRIIGVVDPREPFNELALVASTDAPTRLAETERFTARAVRWPVLAGVTAEGLLLQPKGPATCDVVALPDADWTPEVLAGIEPPPIEGAALARRLAEVGCRVLVPTLIDRDDRWSGNPNIRMLNQPHREFIYRPAFYLGRHLIGYEVQKVLAAVDYFSRQPVQAGERRKIGVVGYSEGGLIAFYSAAVDQRIDAVLVSGYFQRRDRVWREPIYRNVWDLLREFGDAEIASLIAPRGFVVEACRGVEVDGPPPPGEDGRSYAASGTLATPPIESVREEFSRAKAHFERLDRESQCLLVESDEGHGPLGTPPALASFLRLLGVDTAIPPASSDLIGNARHSDAPRERMRRQFEELVAFNQRKYAESNRARARFWADADRSSPETWKTSTQAYRAHFLKDVIGDWPIEPAPPHPRTRLIYETPQWTGYEVVVDVTSGIWAYGILLVPKGIPTGERRPVVVAQHGRGGRPQDVCDPERDHRAYHSFGARLAERGFVVYAPQNLYFGEEAYRLIQRKSNPLGMSFFAPMVWQHRAVVHWLQGLPFVDPDRVAFYGLSYGGKSALLIPAVMEEYCLSICSGAFSDAVKKHIDAWGGNRAVFLFTGEYEHLEFDFAEKFNHAEIAWLISPRPFMVEKGHQDGGLPDEWTASEYARVRRHYVRLGIPDLTEIELFDGGHEINQTGTYAFLHKHLQHPIAGSPHRD